jgi:penicillin-binding protein 2
MNQSQDQHIIFTRRALIVGAAQGLVLAVLGGRLAWLQVAQGEKYKTLADNNRISLRILPPSRGMITDRFGVPLAVNIQDFQVVLTPEQAGDVDRTLRNLRKIITVDDRDMRRVMRDVKNNPRFMPLEVRNNLTWDEVAQVELQLPDLPGITVQSGEVRNYPYRETVAHLVGYVGRVSEKDMTDEPVLRLPGFQIGKNGIERAYETDLRGTPGKIEMEVNVHGREVRPLGKKPASTGARLTLTLDAELQRFVQLRLAQEKSASAVIMDAHSGAVYALASHPAFDPNTFSRGISPMEWEQLRDDITHPMNNKVLTGLYPPGSTFKMLTALAGLKAGVIDENWSVFCPGHYDFGNNRFHCWKKGGHGTVNLHKAIAESCDVYFYRLSTMVGMDRIAQTARQFGLGAKVDFDVPEEKTGLVPDAAWKRKAMKEPWHPGETIIASIGQGYLQSTPLQLATMTARLVNGGYEVKPWVTGAVGQNRTHTKPWPKMDVSDAHLQLMRHGMDAVLLPGGTAYAQRIIEPGFEMGGKTGTSQVKRITRAERAQGLRRQEDLPWRFRHHALFVGYAPLVNPRYVCAVVVEHGGSGSGAAAPIAKDIMLECQKRNPAAKDIEVGA